MNQMSLMLQSSISLIAGVLMLVALFMVWTKTASQWLLLALGGEAVSILFRLLFTAAPSMMGSVPGLVLVWQATGLMVGAGVLGYALELPQRRD